MFVMGVTTNVSQRIRGRLVHRPAPVTFNMSQLGSQRGSGFSLTLKLTLDTRLPRSTSVIYALKLIELTKNYATSNPFSSRPAPARPASTPYFVPARNVRPGSGARPGQLPGPRNHERHELHWQRAV